MTTPTDSDFSYETSKDLYLFTSLTAGSSHIVTATSRIETILKANRIPFKGVDTATDDKARSIFTRRAKGKKLPCLVKEGLVIADLEGVEEWNEYGEIKMHLGPPKKAKKKAAAAGNPEDSAAAAAAEAIPQPPQDQRTPPTAIPAPSSHPTTMPIRTKEPLASDEAPEPPKEPEKPTPQAMAVNLAAEAAAAAKARARAALRASVAPKSTAKETTAEKDTTTAAKDVKQNTSEPEAATETATPTAKDAQKLEPAEEPATISVDAAEPPTITTEEPATPSTPETAPAKPTAEQPSPLRLNIAKATAPADAKSPVLPPAPPPSAIAEQGDKSRLASALDGAAGPASKSGIAAVLSKVQEDADEDDADDESDDEPLEEIPGEGGHIGAAKPERESDSTVSIFEGRPGGCWDVGNALLTLEQETEEGSGQLTERGGGAKDAALAGVSVQD